MASIPNNIVAKDSGGNIKKVDLAEMLQNYVRNDDIQNILSANWPACIKAANLSFVGMDDAEVGLESPYVVNAINLSTAGYGSSNIIYTRQFPVEQRFIVKSADAYRFSISENGVPFGVASNRKCFLVLSLEGYENFGSNTTVDEAECRELGTHGGNPIVLDWSNVVLGEGGKFKFSFKDPAKPVGIFGELKLSSRIENVGNIHRYNIELNFVICGATAWANLNEANRLVLTTTNTSDETTQSSVDLSPLSYPQIHSIGVDGQETCKSFSKTSPSRITFKEGDAISIQVSDADEGNAAFDEKTVSIAMDMESIVGAGLAYENGKLTAPTFIPANGSDGATGGLVPSASAEQFNSVLTASGWRTLEEIGLNSALRPFVGATPEQDGEEGFVPKPLMADSELFLKGDGTWSGAVTDIAGALNCEYNSMPREISFGIGLCNADGDWICPTIQCSVEISHDEQKEGEISLNIPLEEIHGVSLCSPWSEIIPTSLVSNINSWVANKTIWSASKSERFFAAFDNACTATVWLTQVQNADDPTSPTTLLKYCVYGPSCTTSRKITIQIDGAETTGQFEMSAGGNVSIDVPENGNVRIWPEYGKNCIRYDGSSEEDGWFTPEEEPNLISGLMVEASRHQSSLHINVPSVKESFWPKSATSLNLVLDYGLDVEQIGMECLSNWLNARLEAHDKALLDLEHGLRSVSRIFSGATETRNGTQGLVPPASPSDRDRVLMGDGTWGEIYTEPFSGSSDGNGAIGLVPAPANGDADKYLRGDGTWAYPTANINPITEVSFNEGLGKAYRTGEIDLSSLPVVQEMNALLASNPSGTIYVTPNGSISSTEPEGASFAIHFESNNEQDEIHIQEIENGEVISNSAFIVDAEEASYGSLAGKSNEIAVTAIKDPSTGTVSVQTVNIYNVERDVVVTGLKFEHANSITGDVSTSVLDVLYKGASSTENGVPGFVPAASISERDWFLKGDGTWQSIGLYQGATEDLSGIAGLVPPATTDQRGMFLAGDGNWKEIAGYDVYQGATEEISGESGLVPAPFAGQQNFFLAGDGTWKEIARYDVYQGATSSIDGIPGLVPSASTDQQNLFLAGDGTWKEFATYQGATDEAPGSAGLVPAADSTEQGLFLAGDGTWKEVEVNNAPYQGATANTDGIPGLVPAAESSQMDMFLKGDGTWMAIEPFQGATEDEDGTAGLVPAPTIQQRNLYLYSDGTWKEIPLYQGATEDEDGIAGLVPPASSIERTFFLAGDGTWKQSNIYQGANDLESGIAGSVPPALPEEQNFFLAGDGTWKRTSGVYQGATEENIGIAGLVPPASSEQRSFFLAADGTWKEIAIYQGATEEANGVTGTVPPATPAQRSLFLAGDGTWKQGNVYQGATEEANGVTGTVPAATPSERSLFLAGDGTWKQEAIYQGATNESSGIAGIVPAATPAQKDLFLAGDGTWKQTAAYQGATEDASGIAGLVPAAESSERGLFLAGDGTWKTVGVYQGATENTAGVSGLVPAATSAERGKYLAGNGSWASPVQEFDAISNISPLTTNVHSTHSDEYDFASVLEQVNALLQEDSSREVYVSLPDMEVGLEMPEADGLMIHVIDVDGNPAIEIGEIVDGEIVNSTTELVSELQDDGNGSLQMSWSNENIEINASIAFDEQNGNILSINSLVEWPLVWTSSVSGLAISSTNTVTGQTESSNISLSFIGATEDAAGSAGLAPQPQAGDQGKYLRGDGTWAPLVLPNDYQGATENANGIAGLVPAASPAERNNFLRGDGTWVNAAINGSCVCTYVNVKKELTLGVNICDGDGSWLSNAVRVPVSIRPAEVLTYTLNLRFGADGPGGCAIWNPYNATQPTSAEERTYEFYRDATVWGRDTSNHFIQTFSDGMTIDCWIEVDETQAGYHNLKIMVYGPKAISTPRLISLNVDGTNTVLTQQLAAGQGVDIPIEGTEIKIYPRPTYRTVLWRNEISEWSGNASTEPVLLDSTEMEFPYLAYTAQRTETGIRIVADDYSLADWPVELASTTLNLSSGGMQTTIDLGCIPAWVSNELQKIDEAIEQAATAIDRIGLYKGATENENGVAGLVPPALSAERNGTLHGDGTWGSDIVVTNAMPTNSDAGNLFFYIED